MFNFHEISKNLNKFKGFAEFLLILVVLRYFTKSSIAKMRQRPNPGQQNNKHMNLNDFQRCSTILPRKKIQRPIFIAIKQQIATKHNKYDFVIIFNNIWLEKRACGRSQTRQERNSPDFTRLHQTSPESTRIHLNSKEMH